MTLRDFEHSIATALVITACGLAFGLWLHAALAMAALFIGREIAQAEYRWIEDYGDGRRANMPWWGAFDPRVWDLHSMLNWIGPAVIAVAVIVWGSHHG